MADRWNILYIENGKRYIGYHRWYSHFDNTICQGPYAALYDLEKIIDSNDAKDGLLDPPNPVAAIVDFDRFEIGICCEWWTNDIALDSCLQRELYMQWLAILWHGWKLRWLENGQYELFARCGKPYSSEFRRPLKSAPFQQTERFSYGLLTIRNEDGSLHDYKSEHPLQMVLRDGQGFLKQQALWKPTAVEAWPNTSACNTKVTNDYASHAFIDLQAKSIQLHPKEFRGQDTWDPLLLPTLERSWPGWTISIYCGNRQQHLLRTGRDPGPGALGAIDIALCKLATRFTFLLRPEPENYRLLDPVATAAERGFPEYDLNEFQKLLPVTQCSMSEREEVMVRAICIFYIRLQRGEFGSLRWPGCQCTECDALRVRWKDAVKNKQALLEK